MIGLDRLLSIPLLVAATFAFNVHCGRFSVQDICAVRVENLALRQQLIVLRRSSPKRLKLTTVDRIFWLWLRRVGADWRSYLVIVKPENGRRLASEGLSSVLDVEDPSWQARSAQSTQRGSRSDSDDESQQLMLGRTSHPRRVAETRH